MRAPLRSCVELPPLQCAEPGALGAATPAGLYELATRAEASGAGTVWFTGSAGPDLSELDACTTAAGALGVLEECLIGAVCEVSSGGRHPAVIARELSALDVVSQGRGALWLRQEEEHLDRSLFDQWEQFAEAVAICRAVLCDDASSFTGRHFRVTAAVNRPPPCQAGGLTVVIEPPVSGAWIAAHEDARELFRTHVVGATHAIVCDPRAAEIEAWRVLVLESPATGVVVRSTWPWEEALTSEVLERHVRSVEGAGADGAVLRVLPPPALRGPGADSLRAAR